MGRCSGRQVLREPLPCADGGAERRKRMCACGVSLWFRARREEPGFHDIRHGPWRGNRHRREALLRSERQRGRDRAHSPCSDWPCRIQQGGERRRLLLWSRNSASRQDQERARSYDKGDVRARPRRRPGLHGGLPGVGRKACGDSCVHNRHPQSRGDCARRRVYAQRRSVHADRRPDPQPRGPAGMSG